MDVEPLDIEATCPHCKVTLKFAARTGGGDEIQMFAICSVCGELSIHGDVGQLRKPTAGEAFQIWVRWGDYILKFQRAVGRRLRTRRTWS